MDKMTREKVAAKIIRPLLARSDSVYKMGAIDQLNAILAHCDRLEELEKTLAEVIAGCDIDKGEQGLYRQVMVVKGPGKTQAEIDLEIAKSDLAALPEISKEVEQLSDKLESEKKIRIKYQTIVYDILNIIDPGGKGCLMVNDVIEGVKRLKKEHKIWEENNCIIVDCCNRFGVDDKNKLGEAISNFFDKTELLENALNDLNNKTTALGLERNAVREELEAISSMACYCPKIDKGNFTCAPCKARKFLKDYKPTETKEDKEVERLRDLLAKIVEESPVHEMDCKGRITRKDI